MRRLSSLLMALLLVAAAFASLNNVQAAPVKVAATNPCTYDLKKQLNYSAPKAAEAATMAATMSATMSATMAATPGMMAMATKGAAKHILILFIDGGHPEFYTPESTPNILSLAAEGTTFCNARTGFPSDSMPGILDVFTGAPPAVTGLLYDVSYDRHLGMTIAEDEDPQFPKGTDLRDLVRVPTLFQALHQKGMRTSFISKHSGYAVLEGPTWAGAGFDKGDLFLPEQATYETKNNYQDYDTTNFQTLMKLIDDKNPPALFGAYILSPNYAVKKGWASGGKTAKQVIDSYKFEDEQIGKLIAELKAKNLYDSTTIIVTSDHGNTPLTRWIPEQGERSIKKLLEDHGMEVTHYTPDDLYMVYLKDSSKTADAISLLMQPENRSKYGISRILTQGDLAQLGANPVDRTPDFIVIPTDGQDGSDAVVYSNGPKLSEHGGISEADQRIPLFMAGAGIRKGYVSQASVQALQLGPTMAYLLGVDLPSATAGALNEALK